MGCLFADGQRLCGSGFIWQRRRWRFSWQVSGGLGYAFRCDFVGEAAHIYQHIDGGAMFGVAATAGPGYDQGIDIHSVQAGLRFYPGRHSEPDPEPGLVTV